MTKILTTHVGSLPRSQAVADFIFAREREEDYDQAAFDACMTSAVDETVRRQKECGIDIVSDGETSKISYSTYVKDRYTGFSGDSPRNAPADLKLFPSFLERLAQAGGTPQFARPCCTGEVTPKGGDDLKKDLSNLRGALTKHGIQRAFMNAASPGVISQFLPNQHYPSRGDYLAALAEAMQGEYETIVEAGLDIQLDCPDLALARHVIYSDLSDDDFLKAAEGHVDALNHALRNVPQEKIRVHICWGNYEGPHLLDIPMAKVFSTLMRTKSRYVLFETSNPRHAHEWTVFEQRKADIPDDKIPRPWRGRHHDQLCRTPGTRRAAHRSVRRHRRTGSCHRRHRLWLWHLCRLRCCRPGNRVRQTEDARRGRGDRVVTMLTKRR